MSLFILKLTGMLTLSDSCYVLLALIATSTSAPVSDNSQAKIIENENTSDGNGNYHFSYATSNGLTREETGELVNVGSSDEHISVYGVYSYIDTDGTIQTVRYTADENGYQIISQAPEEPPEVIEPISLPPSVVATLLSG